jgi:hypothetical protein
MLISWQLILCEDMRRDSVVDMDTPNSRAFRPASKPELDRVISIVES